VSACAIALLAAPNACAAVETAAADPSAPARAECAALTAQGRRSDAVMACTRALQAVRSGANVRALVSALVDGPAPPTTTGLTIALSIVEHEKESGGNVTAAAAACDIAERMGDMVMLRRCADELKKTAPDDPATARAVAALDARCPPWRFWSGWGLVGCAIAATAAHAGRRIARRRLVRTGLPASAALAAAMFASGATAHADPPPVPQHGWLSKWPIDDEHPEAKIPSESERNADPLQFGYWLQDLTWKAEVASKRGDHAASARYYHAIGVAVPDRAIGFSKACEEYEALGQLDPAIEMCGQALLRDGLTVSDYEHFVHLVLSRPRPLDDKETAALAQVIAHMKEDPAGRDVVDDLECQVGARTSNVAQLEECTAALSVRAPDDSRTISYRWALAVAKGDGDEADRLVERAKAAGVGAGDVERMSRTTRDSVRQRAVRFILFVAAIALLLVGLGTLGRSIAARRKLASQPPG
jgi:hypothetical protein